MTSSSLAGRALIALVLMVGFYALALIVAGILVYIPYAEIVYANKIHPKLVLLCIAGAGVILWSIVPRIDRFTPPGPELLPEEHPKLFAQLRHVADSVGQAMPAEVYLLSDVNAWVSQRGGLMGIGSRRVMGLGLPLLQLLTVSELRAVLAHEFGHYHGGDTMLGPWVYKTRGTIVRTVESLGDSFLKLPFIWYGKMFLRITHAVSRRQEYAADELASRTFGARPLASALRTVHASSSAFDPYWGNEVLPALNAGYRPALANGYARFLEAKPIAEIVARTLDEEIKRGESDPYDTHPALRDRIAAIAALPPGPQLPSDPPAISLLTDVPGVEAQLLAALFGHDPVRKLQPVAWEEMGARVYLPMWTDLVRQHAASLKGITPAQFPTLTGDLAMFGIRLGNDVSQHFNAAEAVQYSTAVLAASLAVALCERGWTVEAPPGDAVALRPSAGCSTEDASSVEPFNIVDRLKSGALTADVWRRQCASLGIAQLDLGALAASLTERPPTP